MNTSKIIRGVVSNGRYTVTAPIVKEDYGLYLQIEGVELPPTYQVDFSNSENNGTSVTMIGNADGVLIPHQFIDSGKDVFAFLYHVGSDFGRTVYKFHIPNKVRPDRTNEQPTPEEQSVIDQAISALNEAVAQTAQDKADADASAQSASADADRAEDAKTDAQNFATQAEQSATDAQISAQASANSATASAQSASQSAQIKADVEELADDAQGYAQASERSASASANSASQAQGYAQSASASAQSASGYASNAQSYSQTASSKASEASQSAATASEKASESAQSATNAQGYAQTAESAKTDAQTAQGLAESARDSAISAKADAESAKADAESARDEAQQAVASISGALADKAPIITDTASGAIASFSDGADDLPLKSLVVDINPVQDLHGQDSPYPAGAINIWDEEWELSGTRINSKNLIPVLPNTSYAWASPTPPTNGLRFYDASKTLLSTVYNVSNGVFTTPADCYYIWFALGSAYGTTYKHDVSINYPSTITTYHPYENICPISGWTQVNVNHSDADMTNPTTLTISLGQTVYGGKLDVLSGVLTVEFADVDLGTLTWTYQTNYHRFNSSGIASRVKIPSNSNVNVGGICSAYVVRSVSQVILNDSGLGVSTSGTIGIIDTRFTDPTEFKTVVDGVHYVYPLATPITIQLTPHEVNSLLGQNNIFADTGDTSCEYRADTKLYIERLTAPDSADMIADANITSGQYFMVGNSLYKATANIANGAQIIVGTNCIRKSLSEALNEINA